MIQSWRVMGLWFGGRVFLVVMGHSMKDCARRLPRAMEDYTLEDLDQVECLWYEQWDPGTSMRDPEWVPVEEVSMHRVRQRQAARESSRGRLHESRLRLDRRKSA
ncbi:hypothetical protein Pan216_08510 [Planctomycetes bacterium Pan216]|uniref:Uncharacterized protein n=1 Tax=Kolteria novifilia TaxID=2527975 RepID=A0A518AZ56_9BACT|nr:hypothetical protein Pan216_08510 [Planctomycetes bacterium Pan216]